MVPSFLLSLVKLLLKIVAIVFEIITTLGAIIPLVMET
jgi:hypothetical protein